MYYNNDNINKIPWVKEFPNKMKLIVYPVEYNNIFYFELVVKAGVIHQNPKHLGFAHFLEHLMSFYPSKVYPNSLENQDKINELGIQMNAYTADDTCGYYMLGLESYSKWMLDMLFNTLINPVWDEKIFEQERGAVCRELMKYIDDPWYELDTLMAKTLYKNTNLACSVKKELNNVKNKLTINNFKEFHKSFYHPEYMVLSIISNQNPNTIYKYLLKKYSNYLNVNPYNGPLHTPKITLPSFNNNKIHFIKSDNNEYKIVFYFPLLFTCFQIPERYYLESVSTILTGGLSNRLYKLLRSKLGAVYNVDSSVNLDPRIPELSHFCIETMTNEKYVKDVINTIKDVIEQFKQITQKEWDQIMNELDLNYNETKQSKSFKDSYEEFNDYILWESYPIVTFDDNYKYHKNITPQQVEQFVNDFLKNKYIIFYSGSKKIV